MGAFKLSPFSIISYFLSSKTLLFSLSLLFSYEKSLLSLEKEEFSILSLSSSYYSILSYSSFPSIFFNRYLLLVKRLLFLPPSSEPFFFNPLLLFAYLDFFLILLQLLLNSLSKAMHLSIISGFFGAL